MKRLAIVTLWGLCLSFSPAHARLVQIIHTNDLHSHLDHATFKERGGYAAVKAKIEQIRGTAQAMGIPSLVLDGGDFSDGSRFNFASEGADVFEILNDMGYDAVVLGNHDWLAGPEHLDWIFSRFVPSFQFVSANFVVNKKRKFLYDRVKPYAEFRFDAAGSEPGFSLAVLGLSTSEFLYRFRMRDEGIGIPVKDPVPVAKKFTEELRKKYDFVVGLTHLGLSTDAEVIHATRGLDLIVGGHSHTCLFDPAYAENLNGKYVPIVQSGHHGEFVGNLLVDMKVGEPLQVVHYSLDPVLSAESPDPAVEVRVQEIQKNLYRDYGDRIAKPFAYSHVALEPPGAKTTVWSQIVVDAMRQSTGADLALDTAAFFGMAKPPGFLTPEMVMDLYPRVFDFDEVGRNGWTIWTNWASGATMWEVLQLFLNVTRGSALVFSNVSFDVKENCKLPQFLGKFVPGLLGRCAENIRVGGKPLNLLKYYRLATSEGISRGARDIHPGFGLILHGSKDTKLPIWHGVEKYIRESLGGVIREKRITSAFLGAEGLEPMQVADPTATCGKAKKLRFPR